MSRNRVDSLTNKRGPRAARLTQAYAPTKKEGPARRSRNRHLERK